MQSFGPWYDAAYVVPGYDYTTWSAGAVRSGPMNLDSGAKYLVEKCEGNFGILLFCPVRQFIRVDSAIIRPDSSGICCAGKTACPTQTCDELNFTDKLAASVNGQQMLSSLSTWKVADEMTSIPGWTCQDMISNRMEIQYSCWESPDFDMTSTSASSTTTMMPTQSSTNNPTASTTPRPSSTTPTFSSSTSGSTTTLPNTTLPTGSTSTDYTNTGSTPNFSSSSTYPTTTPFNTTMSTSKPYTNT